MAYYDYIGFAGLFAAALSIIVLIRSILVRSSDLANTIPYMTALWIVAIALTSAAGFLQGGC